MEKYFFEKAKEDANKMQSGEGRTHLEDEEKIKKEESTLTEEEEIKRKNNEELSPELIEGIMKKVKDINQYGTAFTGITVKGCEAQDLKNEKNQLELSCEALNNVLKHGLLGTTYTNFYDNVTTAEWDDIKMRQEYDIKEKWLEHARKKRIAVIFASIIGRDVKNVKNTAFGKASSIFNTNGNFGIIYNLDNYKETFPFLKSADYYFDKKRDLRSARVHTYRDVHDMEFFNPLSRVTHYIIDKLNIETSNLDYQTFVKTIKSRKNEVSKIITNYYQSNEAISREKDYSKHHSVLDNLDMREPDNIEDYIIAIESYKNYGELIGNSDGVDGFAITHRVAPRKFEGILIRSQAMIPEEEKQKIIQDVVDIMKENDNFLPIYDFNGNLLWPKRVDYEKVKELSQKKDSDTQS